MKVSLWITIYLLCIFCTSLPYSNSEQHLLQSKTVFGSENELNLFDPYIVLRRCPQLPCLYSNQSDLKPLCNTISSYDFNAFSLENNAARTLRHRLPKLSLTSINELHDCMCFHICNDDFDAVAVMPEKDRLRYKEILHGNRYPLRKEHRHFHAMLSELNIDLLAYDSSSGFPLHYDNYDVISSKYQLSWDNFWLYWDTFKDYDMNLLLNTFNSFSGTFKSQFCSSLLHYSHPVEQQEDINQAMDALNMKRQKKPKMVTISLSNSEEAPPHDSVFIEKHIVDKILQEDPEKNDGSLSIHGQKIRLIYSTSFEFHNRLHGRRATHWPEHVDRSWKRLVLEPAGNRYSYDDYGKPIAIHHDSEL